MNGGPKRKRRTRLGQEAHEELRLEILRRDRWRCQSCGAMSKLEVHHKHFRSRGGNDSERNLITLCAICHSLVHRRSS